LHVYYNKLSSLLGSSQQSSSRMQLICAETNRPINKVKDIFQTFAQFEEKYVVNQLISKDANAIDVFSEDD